MRCQLLCPPSVSQPPRRLWARSGARPLVHLLCLCCLAIVAGCDGGKFGKLYPVAGQVKVDDITVNGGNVIFAPVKSMPGATIVGSIDKDGKYSLTTNGKSGAPLGQYKVIVMTKTPGGSTSSVDANPKYMSERTTDINLEVVENPKPNQYDLQLQP